MPWSNQGGGSGGGGWKSGGPWGQPPSGGGQPPDLEELLKRSQERFRRAIPGGGAGFPLLLPILLVGLAVAAFYLLTVRVDQDEQGIVTRFGRYDRTLDPGLNLKLPYPVESVTLLKVRRQNRVEIGANSSGDPQFGGEAGSERLMLTGDGNIIDLDLVILWTISDPKAFLFNMQDPEGTVKDVGESAIREVVGQNKIEPILTELRQKIQSDVQTLMQTTLDSYGAGVRIDEVQLGKASPPAQVIEAFRDVVAAQTDKLRLQNEAEAYAKKVVPEARGDAERILAAARAYGEQVVVEARGEADRFVKIYDEYRKAPDITRKRIFLETMERVFGGMDKIIIDDKGSTAGVVPYLPLDQLVKPKAGAAAGGTP